MSGTISRPAPKLVRRALREKFEGKLDQQKKWEQDHQEWWKPPATDDDGAAQGPPMTDSGAFRAYADDLVMSPFDLLNATDTPPSWLQGDAPPFDLDGRRAA